MFDRQPLFKFFINYSVCEKRKVISENSEKRGVSCPVRYRDMWSIAISYTAVWFEDCKVSQLKINVNCWIWVLKVKAALEYKENVTASKVLLMLRKVAWADSWVITITTQESAHATLRSIKRTLTASAKFETLLCQLIILEKWKKTTTICEVF